MLEHNDNPISEFPQSHETEQDLSIDRMITAFGNHEGKALAVMAMDPGVTYTKNSLHRLMIDIQGNNPGWVMTRGTPVSWCKNSLAPNNVISFLPQDADTSVNKFMLTETGEMAQPLAALLAEWSLRQPSVSLQQLFGSSQSGVVDANGERTTSPSTRLKILQTLVNAEGTLQNVEIAQMLGVPTSSCGIHLASLAEDRIIEYDSFDPIENKIIYHAVPDSNQIKIKYPSHKVGNKLPKAIRTLLMSDTNRSWTQEEIASYFISQGRNDSASFRHSISRILSQFKQNNIAGTNKFDYAQYSIVRMDESMKTSVNELLQSIDRYKNQDTATIQYGTVLRQHIVSNPETVSTLMRKIHEFSPYTHKITSEELQERLIDIIKYLPSSHTRDIQRKYITEYGSIGLNQIRAILNSSSVDNLLIRTDNGQHSFWNSNE